MCPAAVTGKRLVPFSAPDRTAPSLPGPGPARASLTRTASLEEIAATIPAPDSSGAVGLVPGRGTLTAQMPLPGRHQPGGLATLVYGQDITDACMGLEATTAVLEASVRDRCAIRQGAFR